MARAEVQLRDALLRAEHEDLKVSIAGAKHSSGGQSMNPDGVYVDSALFHCVAYDPRSTQVTVCAGSRWSDVLKVLQEQGRAVKVMQSNSDFSVGGTISVNAHGWQNGMPPVGSTVVSLLVMNAQGELPRRWAQMEAQGAELIYARVSLADDGLLERALLTTFTPTDEVADPPPPPIGSRACRVGSFEGRLDPTTVERCASVLRLGSAVAASAHASAATSNNNPPRGSSTMIARRSMSFTRISPRATNSPVFWRTPPPS